MAQMTLEEFKALMQEAGGNLDKISERAVTLCYKCCVLGYEHGVHGIKRTAEEFTAIHQLEDNLPLAEAFYTYYEIGHIDGAKDKEGVA